MPNVRQLFDCQEMLSLQDQIDFQKQYGDITQLLKIWVQPSYFQAMIGFWDLEYKYFTFDTLYKTPTLE